jgi:hypothetical protein
VGCIAIARFLLGDLSVGSVLGFRRTVEGGEEPPILDLLEPLKVFWTGIYQQSSERRNKDKPQLFSSELDSVVNIATGYGMDD